MNIVAPLTARDFCAGPKREPGTLLDYDENGMIVGLDDYVWIARPVPKKWMRRYNAEYDERHESVEAWFDEVGPEAALAEKPLLYGTHRLETWLDRRVPGTPPALIGLPRVDYERICAGGATGRLGGLASHFCIPSRRHRPATVSSRP